MHFSLTAWPLIRDVFFYSVSLVILVVFFNDNLIMWYEALILFLWYFAYVGFMKFNDKTEDKLREVFGLPAVVSQLLFLSSYDAYHCASVNWVHEFCPKDAPYPPCPAFLTLH